MRYWTDSVDKIANMSGSLVRQALLSQIAGAGGDLVASRHRFEIALELALCTRRPDYPTDHSVLEEEPDDEWRRYVLFDDRAGIDRQLNAGDVARHIADQPQNRVADVDGFNPWDR